MSLFSRAHDIVAAKTNRALDSAENPNEMLDYSYEQMLEHLTRVRQALVDIALIFRFVRSGGTPMLAMMGGPPPTTRAKDTTSTTIMRKGQEGRTGRTSHHEFGASPPIPGLGRVVI